MNVNQQPSILLIWPSFAQLSELVETGLRQYAGAKVRTIHFDRAPYAFCQYSSVRQRIENLFLKHWYKRNLKKIQPIQKILQELKDSQCHFISLSLIVRICSIHTALSNSRITPHTSSPTIGTACACVRYRTNIKKYLTEFIALTRMTARATIFLFCLISLYLLRQCHRKVRELIALWGWIVQGLNY